MYVMSHTMRAAWLRRDPPHHLHAVVAGPGSAAGRRLSAPGTRPSHDPIYPDARSLLSACMVGMRGHPPCMPFMNAVRRGHWQPFHLHRRRLRGHPNAQYST